MYWVGLLTISVEMLATKVAVVMVAVVVVTVVVLFRGVLLFLFLPCRLNGVDLAHRLRFLVLCVGVT